MWQLVWRRPVWRRTANPPEQDDSAAALVSTGTTPISSSEDAITHVGAVVLPHECFLHQNNQKVDTTADSVEHDLEAQQNRSSSTYLLTATLLSSTSSPRRDHSGAILSIETQPRTGDVLILQLLRHEQKPVPNLESGSTARSSELLSEQVPGTTLDTMTQQQQHLKNDTSRQATAARKDDCDVHIRSLQTVELRWPSSALMQTPIESSQQQQTTQCEQPLIEVDDDDSGQISMLSTQSTQQSRQQAKGGRFFSWVWGGNRRGNTYSRPPPPSSGLVSLALCRLPPDNPAALSADALDVLHLLALGHRQGLSGTQQEWLKHKLYTKSNQRSSSQRGISEGSDTENEHFVEEPLTDLILVCVALDGKIYFYSPWKLVWPEYGLTAGGHLANDDSDDAAMASFLLGSQLWSAVQRTMLALSRPQRTLSLSIPLVHLPASQRSINQREGSITAKPESTLHRRDSSSLSVWDGSLWDPTLDKASLAWQTRSNQVTHCVFALEYVCVAGRGHRRRRQRRTPSQPPSPYYQQQFPTTHQTVQLVRERNETALSDVRAKLERIRQARSQGLSVASPPRIADKAASDAESNEVDAAAEDTVAASVATSVQGSPAPASGATSVFQDGIVDNYYDGGFVTFVSLQTYSETRTVFLPFVPIRMSPFVWGGMYFLLVIGEDGNAVAIRMDASEVSTVRCGDAPSLFVANTPEHVGVVNSNQHNKPEETSSVVSIRRFQVLPLVWPSSPDEALVCRQIIVGSTIGATPPCLAILFQNGGLTDMLQPTEAISLQQYSLQSVNLVDRELVDVWFSSYGQRFGIQQQFAAIELKKCDRHFTRIELCARPTLMVKPWCHLGQGWAIMGALDKALFISFDGSTTEKGAIVRAFSDLPENHSSVGGEYVSDPRLMCQVLPSNPFVAQAAQEDSELELSWRSPFTVERKKSHFDESRESDTHSTDEAVDHVIAAAVQSISSTRYRESMREVSPSQFNRRRSLTFSHREKSRRLALQCSTWTHLEQVESARLRFQCQVPVASLWLGGACRHQRILSLRDRAVAEGAAIPFYAILSWMSENEDYFTATTLALALLRDSETLRHLWMTLHSSDDDYEVLSFQGLLDGIIPLYSEQDERSILQSTIVHLADMVVACLIKGGGPMSSTLEHFLQKNSDYDASRACLMLAAALASAVSDANDAFRQTGEKRARMQSETLVESILWPVRCLLLVGVTRKRLTGVLLMLNATIPDELRGRNSPEVQAVPYDPRELCGKLVASIAVSSSEAIELIMGLIDEQSRLLFWDSIDTETRLQLSLIAIEGKCPLLTHPDVRSWIVGVFLGIIESSGVQPIRTEWLQSLCCSCLTNAECHIDRILALSHESLSNLHVSRDDEHLEHYTDMIKKMRESLVPGSNTGGIDFDIIIPALLLLTDREAHWHPASLGSVEVKLASTRLLLNTVCYVAGRYNARSMFALDSARLMRQCYLMGDISAGANLVGGKSGLILECCYILIESFGLTMETSESFLTSDRMVPISIDAIYTGNIAHENDNVFHLDKNLVHILWLLQEHVLMIRTFGEFETTNLRGRVDPVLAARCCFRTWWFLIASQAQQGTNMNNNNWEYESTLWLVQWLSQKLEITSTTTPEGASNQKSFKTSPYGLVCAALVRALLWPTTITQHPSIQQPQYSYKASEHQSIPPRSDDVVLAQRLHLPNNFLIVLCQSCCGLVEALPSQVAEQVWIQLVERSTSTTNSSNSGGGSGKVFTSPPGTNNNNSFSRRWMMYTSANNETVDDSFASAVSAIVSDRS